MLNDSHGRCVTMPSINNTLPGIVVPEGCVVLQFLEFDPFDNPDSLVSRDQERAFAAFMNSVLLPVFFLIAFPGNIITAIVFYRHGFRERVNLCVFCQSVLDAGYVLNTMVNVGDAIFHGFDNKVKANIVGNWYLENHLNGFYGLDSASKILSTIIASERCFCVAYPLKAQGLMKTRTMGILILLVTVVSTGGHFVVAARWSSRCLYNPVVNSTFSAFVVSDFYLANQTLVDFLDAIVYGIMIPGTTVTMVTAATAYTGFKLKQMSVWREKSTSTPTALSRQDATLTRMLIGTSILFVTCTIGYFCSRLVLLLNPDFNLNGRQANMFILISLLTLGLTIFRPAFNFFVYFIVGSRFRKTTRGLFCRSGAESTSEIKLDTVDTLQ